MMRRRFVMLLSVLTLLGLPLGASAEGPADFYRGKTVRLVVGFAPGGGYDAYARLLAPHMERFLGADIIVENRPGAAGILALNQVYAADPNGLRIILTQGSAMVLSQLVNVPGVRFDFQRMPVLGRVTFEHMAVSVGGGSPFKSVGDLLAADRPIKWAMFNRIDTAIWSEVTGLELRTVAGYSGSREGALATARGEIDGLILSTGTTARYARSGEILPIAIMARERSSLLPDVPTIFEAAPVSEHGAQWVDFRADAAKIGRILVTPPGVPEERVAWLRRAFAAAMAEEALRADADRLGRSIAFASGAETEALIQRTFEAAEGPLFDPLRTVLLDRRG